MQNAYQTVFAYYPTKAAMRQGFCPELRKAAATAEVSTCREILNSVKKAPFGAQYDDMTLAQIRVYLGISAPRLVKSLHSEGFVITRKTTPAGVRKEAMMRESVSGAGWRKVTLNARGVLILAILNCHLCKIGPEVVAAAYTRLQ